MDCSQDAVGIEWTCSEDNGLLHKQLEDPNSLVESYFEEHAQQVWERNWMIPDMRNVLHTKLLKTMLLNMYNTRLMKTILKKSHQQSTRSDESSWGDYRFSTRNFAWLGTNLEGARRILGMTFRKISTEDQVLITSLTWCKGSWHDQPSNAEEITEEIDAGARAIASDWGAGKVMENIQHVFVRLFQCKTLWSSRMQQAGCRVPVTMSTSLSSEVCSIPRNNARNLCTSDQSVRWTQRRPWKDECCVACGGRCSAIQIKMWDWQPRATLSVCWTVMDSNTPILRSRDAVNDTGEHLDSKVQTWTFMWRLIKPMSDERRETEDGVWFWIRLTRQGSDLFVWANGGSRQVGFCWRGTTCGQWSSQWASLVNSYLSQGILPCEIRWHRLGTTLRTLKRWFRAGQRWMLEKWRMWRRINWKQYSKENTEIRENFRVPEQVRDEDVSIKKEQKRANVATIRRTKPIVASVLQYCSNCKIGILQAMDPTLH